MKKKIRPRATEVTTVPIPKPIVHHFLHLRRLTDEKAGTTARKSRASGLPLLAAVLQHLHLDHIHTFKRGELRGLDGLDLSYEVERDAPKYLVSLEVVAHFGPLRGVLVALLLSHLQQLKFIADRDRSGFRVTYGTFASFGLNESTITRILLDLEKAGLIVRERGVKRGIIITHVHEFEVKDKKFVGVREFLKSRSEAGVARPRSIQDVPVTDGMERDRERDQQVTATPPAKPQRSDAVQSFPAATLPRIELPAARDVPNTPVHDRVESVQMTDAQRRRRALYFVDCILNNGMDEDDIDYVHKFETSVHGVVTSDRTYSWEVVSQMIAEARKGNPERVPA